MTTTLTTSSSWILALESSSPCGGAALFRDGTAVGSVRLEEGLRHGRDLLPAAAGLFRGHGITAADLACVTVSCGPGSYTGLRVGVMAAKTLAYATGARLTAVSSLAALAFSRTLDGTATPGDRVMAVQDARRDEVYAGLYLIGKNDVTPLFPDRATTPEEAATMYHQASLEVGRPPVPSGIGFTTYADLFATAAEAPGNIDPVAVGMLGWRNFMREDFADPLLLQPVYLRRDVGGDWRHDHLITQP